MNKLFTDLGGKFKFSAQDRNLEYLFCRSKNSQVSSDKEPPLEYVWFKQELWNDPFIMNINFFWEYKIVTIDSLIEKENLYTE